MVELCILYATIDKDIEISVTINQQADAKTLTSYVR